MKKILLTLLIVVAACAGVVAVQKMLPRSSGQAAAQTRQVAKPTPLAYQPLVLTGDLHRRTRMVHRPEARAPQVARNFGASGQSPLGGARKSAAKAKRTGPLAAAGARRVMGPI